MTPNCHLHPIYTMGPKFWDPLKRYCIVQVFVCIRRTDMLTNGPKEYKFTNLVENTSSQGNLWSFLTHEIKRMIIDTESIKTIEGKNSGNNE